MHIGPQLNQAVYAQLAAHTVATLPPVLEMQHPVHPAERISAGQLLAVSLAVLEEAGARRRPAGAAGAPPPQETGQ